MAGTVLTTVPARVQERFWQHVDRRGWDECWPWLLSVGSHGYGQIGWGWSEGRGLVLAHRLAFALAVEDLPLGRGRDAPTVDHVRELCSLQICCNPRHLRKLPNRENAGDNANRAKTHCPRGHEYTPGNTSVRPTGRGGLGRWCIQCQNDYNASRY